VVEAIALALIRRPLVFGPVAGLAAGAIGFAAEWPWVNSVYPIHWNSGLLPEGAVIAAIAGIAGGTIGALFGVALNRQLPDRPRVAPALAVGSLAAIMGCFAFGLADRTPTGASAQISLTEVKPAPQREVMATVRFSPAHVTDGASWVREIAWQGGSLVGAQLERIGPDVYRTPEPLPVYGKWKSALRIENGHTLLGVSIYAPADPAIPAPGVAATPTINRPLENDRELLQRERKRDLPGWLWPGASLSVLGLALAFLTLLSVALARYARGPRDEEASEAKPDRTRPKLPTTPRGARA
jgi:hypothetical protein